MADRWKIPAPASTTSAAADRSGSRSKPIVHDQRCVIGKTRFLVDEGLPGRASQTGAQDLVVDSPSDVPGPGRAAVRPPGVVVRVGNQRPKAIDVALLVDELVHPCALLRQEARILLVRAPV